MGQEISCPCHNDSNVLPADEDDEEIVVVAHKVPNSPSHTALNTTSSTQSSNPFDNKSRQGTPVGKVKSRKWDAQPKDGTAGNLETSARSTQVRIPCGTGVPPYCLQDFSFFLVWFLLVYLVHNTCLWLLLFRVHKFEMCPNAEAGTRTPHHVYIRADATLPADLYPARDSKWEVGSIFSTRFDTSYVLMRGFCIPSSCEWGL